MQMLCRGFSANSVDTPLMGLTLQSLLSDQGRQFESKLMQQICGILKISKSRTTSYHPQCGGLVERFYRTLKNMLATSPKDHPFDWEDAEPSTCQAEAVL